MFSKFFQLSFFAIFLMTHTLHASSSSSSASQDDDGEEVPKVATTTPLPNRAELLKQFQRLSGYPEPGYYVLTYEGAARVPGGIWGMFPWNWSYDIRVQETLDELANPYDDAQLIALMARKDFHGCLKLSSGYGKLQDFWDNYGVFNRGLKKSQRSNKLSWQHFLVTPAVLKAAQDVHELNCGGADLKVLPALPNLYLLQSLNLSGNGLSGLPASISQMTNLGHLDLSNNQFAAIPDEVQHLTNLKSLYVEHNSIAQSPPWMGKLKKLETLDLSDNRLKGVGSSHELPALTHLYLLNNQIASLDAGFFTPTLLEVNLSGNKLESLPETLGSATNLLELGASDNQLKTLPKALGSLKKLGTLRVKGNKLTELPAEIAGLEALKNLDVSNNKVTALPEGISRLVKLERLKASHNKLAALPGEYLSNLNQLITADLSHNQIVALDILGLPKSLRVLNIHGNSIAGVSTHLLGLSALRTLTLDSKAWNGQNKPDSLVLSIDQKELADKKKERTINVRELSPDADDDSDDDSDDERISE